MMSGAAVIAEHEVRIPSGGRTLSAILSVPAAAKGVVAFAHGSGSGALQSSQSVCGAGASEGWSGDAALGSAGGRRDRDRSKVFDINLLADRLQSATDWLQQEPATRELRLGYFGASTGAGAALAAAARDPAAVSAVVSRGGRPRSRRRSASARPGAHLVDRRRIRRGGHRAECRPWSVCAALGSSSSFPA
jgi:putative phosphoribosyl transferase